MNRNLAAPSAGQPIRASFFAEILREIRANRPLSGKNTRTHRTPNGTHIEAVATGGRSAAATDVGRFSVKLKAEEAREGEDQTYTATFKNPYFDVGGKTYEMVPEESESEQSEIEIYNVEDGSIICLKVTASGEVEKGPKANLVAFSSLAELQLTQEDMDFYTVPLYKVQGGKVVCDFRTGPTCAMGEF